MKRPERAIILLKPQYLGDAVMACPLIDSLAAAYGRPVVMCGPLVQEVLEGRSESVSFEQGAKITGIRAVFQTARQLRTLKIEHAFVVNRSFRSALAARLAGIPMRVGHATEGRGFLLTHKVPYDEAKFEADCYLDLARALQIPITCEKPRLEANADPSLVGNATIGLQPGARYPNKQVPLKVMAEVARDLQNRGHHLALLGGRDERKFVDPFQELLREPALDLVGMLDIRGTMAALRSLKLAIGSDTGLMHLAAALGTPTVTVFGPNPSSKWGHDYPPHRVLTAESQDVRLVRAEAILASADEIAIG